MRENVRVENSEAAKPIATVGQVFDDGSVIELVHLPKTSECRLAYWNGQATTIGAQIEHRGQLYEPAILNASVLGQLVLPTASTDYGTARELYSEIAKPISHFSALPYKFVALLIRAIFGSWLSVGPVAPLLLISGPNSAQALQLLNLLSCFCRHSIRVADVNPTNLCSLPSDLDLTLLISNSNFTERLQSLLEAAGRRGQGIPRKGRLLNLFGMQAVALGADAASRCSSTRAIRIPAISMGDSSPTLDRNTCHKIGEDFQAKLLRYRFTELPKTSSFQFDPLQFVPSLRDLAYALKASTPGDCDLQYEVDELLWTQKAEIDEARWTEINVVLVEVMLALSHRPSQTAVYVGEIAECAQEILIGRGAATEVEARAVGPLLRNLGFRTEPRNYRGVSIDLTKNVRRLAHELARDFSVPSEGAPNCDVCDEILRNGNADDRPERLISLSNRLKNSTRMPNEQSPAAES